MKYSTRHKRGESNKKQEGHLETGDPLELVEVAGIEPASENLSRKASTCVVRVLDLTDQGSHGQDT